MKRFVKEGAVRLLGPLFRSRTGRRGVVLCYHSIHPAKAFASATPSLFDAHLRWLVKHCKLVRFSEMLHALAASSDKPVVAITFDDGYADNYEQAFPLLLQHNVPATFFVTAGLIERRNEVITRFQLLRRCGIQEIRPLTWRQLREMQVAGMEIGSHTYSHPNLARLSARDVSIEFRKSKDVLEQGIGERVNVTAYPFGKPKIHLTAETIELAGCAGYVYGGVITFRGIRRTDSPLALPRICIANDNVSTIGGKVAGDWDVIGIWQESVPMWVARLVSPEDFLPEVSTLSLEESEV